jgi:hypothetical protein
VAEAADPHCQTQGLPDMTHLALCLILPGLAILAAALAQLLLNAVGPNIEHLNGGGFSADSYFALAAIAVFSFAAGWWSHRLSASPMASVLSGTLPTAWCGLWLWALMRPGADTAWLRAATLFTLSIAVVPLVAVLAGRSLASIRQRRRGPLSQHRHEPT